MGVLGEGEGAVARRPVGGDGVSTVIGAARYPWHRRGLIPSPNRNVAGSTRTPWETLRPVRLFVVAALVAAGLAALPSSSASGDDIDEVRARAQALTQDLADAESRLGRLEQDITTAQHQTEEAEREIAGLQSQVQELAVQQYVRPTEVLFLVGEDLTRQTRADASARIVSRGDVDALDRFQGAQEDLEAASAHLVELQADQEDAVAELEQRQDDLEVELARLQELERQRREAEERARQEAAAAAATAAAAADDDPPPTDGGGGGGGGDGGGGGGTPPPSGGGIICPVQGPVAFSDTWGAARSGGREPQGRRHAGRLRHPIVAPVSGNVELRTGASVACRSTSTATTATTTTAPTCRATPRAAPATWRRHGDRLRGRHRQRPGTPHLHFEIHPGGGSAVNPYPAIAAACC